MTRRRKKKMIDLVDIRKIIILVIDLIRHYCL